MKKITREWKEQNKEYLKELQAFFDTIENVKNEQLKENIRYHMLKCDAIITDLAEEMFTMYYREGVTEREKCIKK